MQNNTIVFRADKNMLEKIKNTSREQGVTHSHVIRDAIEMYYKGDTSMNTPDLTPHLRHLEGEILYLRNQNTALLLMRQPLLARWIQRLKHEQP